MGFSELFIRRPVGTTLLAIGLFLVGAVAYVFLPVANMPTVEFPTIRVSASQGIQLMQDKRADALFYTVGLGASAIQQLALTTPIALVAVDLNRIQAIAKKYPFYVGFNIPGGTYKGVDVTTPTVAVQAMLIASEKLSEETVYKFMKAVFGNLEAFKKIHPNLERFFSLEKAVKGLPIPLHPGAERFYKEAGVLK